MVWGGGRGIECGGRSDGLGKVENDHMTTPYLEAGGHTQVQ